MKRFFLSLLFSVCVFVCRSGFAQAPPIINYTSPVTLTNGTTYTTGTTPVTPVSSGGAVGTGQLSYSNTTTQPYNSASFTNPARGGADASGNVFIGNYAGNGFIQEFAIDGTTTNTHYGNYAPLNTSGIVFDSQGNMYILTGSGSLYKTDPSGVFSGVTYNFNPKDTTTIATLGLAIDAADSLYVTYHNTVGPSDIIYKIGTSLTSPRSFTTASLNYPVDLGFDSAGELFVLNFNDGSIYKYTNKGVPGTSAYATISAGSYAMRVDPINNYLYVADNPAKKIYVCNTSGTAVDTVYNTLTGPNDCRGLIIDGLGGLYAPDFSANIVYKYSPTSTYFLNRSLPAGLSFSTSTGQVTGKSTTNTVATNYGIGAWNAYGPSENLVNIAVASSTAPTISYATSPQSYPTGTTINPTLSPTTTNVTSTNFGYSTTPTQPFTSGTFTTPTHVAVDNSGNVYVLNGGSKTVSKFTSTGALVTNTYCFAINHPSAMVFDTHNNLLMISSTDTLALYGPTGTFVGSEVIIPGGGYTTLGLAIDATNTAYVTGYKSGSNLVYQIAPTTYATSNYLTTTTKLSTPVALDVDSTGAVYVLNQAGTIFKYATATSAPGAALLTPTAGTYYGLKVDPVNQYIYLSSSAAAGKLNFYNLSGAAKGTALSSIANNRGIGLDLNGNVFMPDSVNNKVYVYSPSGSFFINKQLPTGLSMLNTSGVISGNPSEATPATDYTVTVWKSGVGGSGVVNIATYATDNWKGTTNNDWSTATNWSVGIPTSTSYVTINTTGTTNNFPQIGNNINAVAGNIVIGTSNTGTKPSPSITFLGTGSLTVSGDITFQQNSGGNNAVTATLTGSGGTITANNLYVDNTTGSNNSTYTIALNSTVGNLTLNKNLSLKTAEKSSSKAQSATFALPSGTTTLTLNGVVTSNSADATSTITLGTGAAVYLTSPTNSFTGLSSTGTNALTLPTTIGFTGNNDQTIYIPTTPISNTNPAKTYGYTNLVLGGTGVKTPSSTTLTIAGNFKNTLANDASNYANFSGTAVTFSSTSPQTLDGGSGNGTILYTVGFTGTGTKTINSGNIAIGSSGVLTMNAGAPLVVGTSGTLTLNSDANSSAQVPTLGSGASITGNVSVQRFLTGGVGMRGYRALSSPVYASTVSGNNVYSINYVGNSAWITGSGTGTSIDKQGNPTLYLFRQDKAVNSTSFVSGNFRGVSDMGTAGDITNVNYTIDVDGGPFNIPVGNGFLFFFRGDKNKGLLAQETVTTYIPTSTVLTAVGTLNQGTITVHDWFAPTPTSDSLSRQQVPGNHAIRGYNLVGNPYASPIDWTQVYGASTGIGQYAYQFNARSNQYGAIQQGQTSGTVNTSNIINSGQGFFVVADTTVTAHPKLVFTEAAKVSTQPQLLLMGIPAGGTVVAQPEFIHLKLEKDTNNYDDVIVNFAANASAKYSFNEDALHLTGNSPAETLTVLSSDSVKLAIDYRPLPNVPVYTVGLYVSAPANGIFKFYKTDLQNIPGIYEIWLKDNYLKDSLDMRSNAIYSFSIDLSNPATYGSGRFQLVFRQSADLALHLLNFTGAKVANVARQSQLTWTVENESNYTTFYVQRSVDGGKTYSSIGSLQSDGSGTYNFVDKNPVLGQNLYRLQLDDINNNITYSQVITLQFSDLSNNSIAGSLSVFPNPAHSTVNVEINAAGASNAFSLLITSNNGTIVKSIGAAAPSSQQDVSYLSPGTYYIRVIDNGTKTVVAQSKFVKL